jgi:hypothetical protein
MVGHAWGKDFALKSHLVTAVVAGAVALAGGSLSAATASAATAKVSAKVSAPSPRSPKDVQLPSLVSQTPVKWTPNVYGGANCGSLCKHATIYSTVVVGSEVVVAGNFGSVCAPGTQTYAQCPNTVSSPYIFAFNLGTGAIDPSFIPVLNTGPVYSLAVGPNDTVYAGGAFSTVNGTSAQGLVQLSVTPGLPTDGQVVPTFAGHTTGTVNAIVLQGNALYVGGSFSAIDGAKQHGIARLNATTGAMDTSFKFTISNAITGTALSVNTMSVTPDGNVLAIGGTFLTVGGQPIPRIALIDTGGGVGATATLANWAAPILSNNCSNEHDYVKGIDFSPDGSFFVVSTTGYRSAGGASICDAAARFEAAPTGANVQPSWVDYTGGDTLRSVAVTSTTVYLGGHQRWANNECGNNRVCEANAVLVNGLAAVDANTGLALPWWHPQTARGTGVQSLTAFGPGAYPSSNGGLIIGTDVSNIAGTNHSRLAMFPLDSTAIPTPGGPILSGIFSQGRLGGTDESTTGVAAMCVDGAGNSSNAGNPVQLSTCANSNEQNWTIEPDGTIQLNGLCLDTAGGGTAAGTLVVLDTCASATSSQQWTQGAGNTVVNTASGRCLDDPGASTTNGTQLQIWDCNGSIQQVWPLPVAQAPPPPPPSGPLYSAQVQSNTDAPCMAEANHTAKAGSKVQLWTCFGYSWENWTMMSDGTIRIGGLCLDTAGQGTSDGTLTVLNNCDSSGTQVWTPGPNYSLVNQGSGLCLDDPGFNTANGTQLQIYTCNGGQNQEWRPPTY